ncbi:MAG TPA: LytR C-terminal domain-containing protein [Gemmatimonadales bacterium]|nr:LytR C-terminal domain-containing protein [Gemmatimonadales bacterium]
MVAAVGLAVGVRLLVPPPPPEPRAQAFPIPSPEHRVTVEVLNGTKRPGVARAATRMLRRRGLDVVYFGNADEAVDSTRVIVRRGDPGRGRDVRLALGAGRILVEPDTLRRVDVSVILGADFRVTGSGP